MTGLHHRRWIELQVSKEETEDLLKEINRMMQNPIREAVDHGFVTSFISYSAGIAHSYALSSPTLPVGSF